MNCISYEFQERGIRSRADILPGIGASAYYTLRVLKTITPAEIPLKIATLLICAVEILSI